MSKLRVCCFSLSLDGFGAGPNQTIDSPLGEGGEAVHKWVFPTRTFQRKVMGKNEGTSGPDDDFVARGFDNIGAWILGRNMFGPIRGAWPDDEWKGWWATIHPIIRMSSCSPITRASRSPWRAARSFTS